MRYKIVIDSCGELVEKWKDSPAVERASLTLTVDDEDIIDDDTFDQAYFLKRVAESPNCPKSSCPSPERYMSAYDCEAEHVYAVTLSSELSGSYNSAVLGMNLLKETQRHIHTMMIICMAMNGQSQPAEGLRKDKAEVRVISKNS